MMKSQSVWTLLLIAGLLSAGSSPAGGACGLWVGDRVEAAVDHPDGHPTLWKGMRGTVICFDEGSLWQPVLVSWDGWIAGHENVWYCDAPALPHVPFSCWWVTCSEITLVGSGRADILDGGEQDRFCRPHRFIAGQANQAMEVSFTVVNGGTGDPPNPIYVKVYASRDTSITSSDYYLGETNCFVSRGGSLQMTVKTTLPTQIPAGFYYIGWIMDPDNLIPNELDEMNNRAYLTSYRIVVAASSSSPCLELSAAQGGRITAPGEGVFVYTSAREVSVAASPDRGCSFAGWVGTAVETGKVANPDSASTQVLVDAQYSLTAVFSGPHLMVEDFEDYNNVNPVGAVWIDGLGWEVGDPQGHPGNDTGAIVGNAEWPTPGNLTIHGGAQAMVFDYDNGQSPYYSEASRRWGTLQNWAATGAEALSIWYRGAAGNSAQPLYAVIRDWYRTEAVMTHPDDLAVLDREWSQWTIPLEDIQKEGVMLSRVLMLYLGVGDRASPFIDGSGTLYFDDITLVHTGSGSLPGGAPPADGGVTVENSSFEFPGTVKIKGWNGEGVGGTPAVDIPGWRSDTAAADSGVQTGYTPTDGLWTAFLKSGDPGVWQLTNHAIGAGEVFELKVDARVISNPATTLLMVLYYDYAGIRIPAAIQVVGLTNAMQEHTVSFDATHAPASVGKRIGIEFTNVTAASNSWAALDNVRLTLAE